jgi:hypothetical protein
MTAEASSTVDRELVLTRIIVGWSICAAPLAAVVAKL